MSAGYEPGIRSGGHRLRGGQTARKRNELLDLQRGRYLHTMPWLASINLAMLLISHQQLRSTFLRNSHMRSGAVRASDAFGVGSSVSDPAAIRTHRGARLGLLGKCSVLKC